MYGQNKADDRVAVACDKDVLLKELNLIFDKKED